MLVFSGMDAKKQAEAEIVIKERMRQSDEEEKRQETAESSVVRQEMAGYNAAMRERGQSESGGQQPVQSESAMLAGKSEMVQTKQIVVEEQHRANATQTDPFEKLFVRADYIDAFDDDYFYDCIEVSPEKLKCLNQNEIDIAGNSFLLHGYYNFRHILFGRVRDNLDNTKYFIGVPGMYCNRERYMASMFGFNNFKKSHRSDYANPYFGYWYQEI